MGKDFEKISGGRGTPHGTACRLHYLSIVSIQMCSSAKVEVGILSTLRSTMIEQARMSTLSLGAQFRIESPRTSRSPHHSKMKNKKLKEKTGVKAAFEGAIAKSFSFIMSPNCVFWSNSLNVWRVIFPLSCGLHSHHPHPPTNPKKIEFRFLQSRE